MHHGDGREILARKVFILPIAFSEVLRPLSLLEAAEHNVDWLKLGCRSLLAIRSSRLDRYRFHKKAAKNTLRPTTTVNEMNSIVIKTKY